MLFLSEELAYYHMHLNFILGTRKYAILQRARMQILSMIEIFLQKYSTDTEITPPLPPVGVNEECLRDSCGENANCKVQKNLRISDMQFL